MIFAKEESEQDTDDKKDVIIFFFIILIHLNLPVLNENNSWNDLRSTVQPVKNPKNLGVNNRPIL